MPMSTLAAPAFLLGALLIVVLFAARRTRWITLLWMPVTAYCGWFSLKTFVLVNVPNSPGPDGGFVGMAVMFTLLMALPVIILFVLCLFAVPRDDAWNIPYNTAAGLLTVCMFVVTHSQSSETVEFQVLDAHGIPVADWPLSFTTMRIKSVGLGEMRTGRDGKLKFSHLKGEGLTVTSAERTGMMGVSLDIGKVENVAADESVSDKPRHLRWEWSQYALCSVDFAETRKIKDGQPWTIFQRPAETPLLPTVQKELKSMMGSA
jgi:hypothetical protein